MDDLSDAAVRALLALHLAGMHASSPPGHVFALDLSGLQTPDVTVWTAWDGAALAGIGALKRLGHGTGGVKSMPPIPTIYAAAWGQPSWSTSSGRLGPKVRPG